MKVDFTKDPVASKHFYGDIQFQMPRELAKMLIQEEKSKRKIGDPQAFLCDYVNKEFGLQGYCTEVVFI